MEWTSLKGPIMVKAKKVGESGDDYLLEFELSHQAKIEFLAELLIEHVKNNTLTVTHIYEQPKDLMERMAFLKQILKDHESSMSEDLKSRYLLTILEYSSKLKQ